MITNAKIHGTVRADDYNKDDEPRGSQALTVRAHILQEILRNARRWVRGYISPPSASKEFGDAFDCLLLVPHHWPLRFCVTPLTYTTKEGKQAKWRNDKRNEEVREWLEEHEGLTVVDQKTNASVHGALARLKEDEMLMDVVNSSRHQTMVTAQWHDTETGLIIPLKCLIDIEPPKDHPVFGNCLFDAKTTRNASPKAFGSDAMRFRYDLQGAFYVDMYNAATGEARDSFGHLIVENYPPYEYRTPPPLLTQRFIQFGRLSYQAALHIYCQALTSGKWPSYDLSRSKDWPKTDCADWFLNLESLYPPSNEDDLDDHEEEGAPEEQPEEPTDIMP